MPQYGEVMQRKASLIVTPFLSLGPASIKGLKLGPLGQKQNKVHIYEGLYTKVTKMESKAVVFESRRIHAARPLVPSVAVPITEPRLTRRRPGKARPSEFGRFRGGQGPHKPTPMVHAWRQSSLSSELLF